jgi:beta-N-acetylhexosaminidase
MVGLGAATGRRGEARPAARARQAGLAALLFASLVVFGACGLPFAGAAGGHAAAPDPTRTPRPWPTAAATVAPDLRLQAVNARIAKMTLDQELGQLFIVEYVYADPNHSDLDQMFGQMGAGGVILYQSMNIFSIPQMQQLTHAMQARAAIPLIIGADEEGGGDDQTNQIFGPHPDNWDIGATGDPNVAAQNAARIAGELKQLGMNTDFAPVVDVEAPSRGWTRAFGRSPDLVSQMGAAQVDAFQSRGIMASLKHFPGLGAATINPHEGLPVIDSTRDHIEQYDLAPYRALLSHQPAMVMTTDLLMPALDPNMPAELSYPIVTGILRKEIGYDGVVITDALYMGGIADHWSMAQAGVLSIEAGNDMLEGPWDADQMRAMVDALRAAVQSGHLTKERIDESVRRILLLKMRFGLLGMPPSRGQRDVALAQSGPAGPAGGALVAGDAAIPEARRRG